MKRHLAALLTALLLVPHAVPLASAENLPGGGSQQWDYEVDVSKGNPCLSIQTALYTLNSSQVDGPKRIRVFGTGVFTFADTHRARQMDYNLTSTTADDTIVNSPLHYCFTDMPSLTYEGVWPVVDRISGNSSYGGGGGTWDSRNRGSVIFFDNVDLTYDCDGPNGAGGSDYPDANADQDDATYSYVTAGWMRGGSWQSGKGSSDAAFSGFTNEPPYVEGHITWNTNADCDDDGLPGRITEFARSTTTVLESTSSFVAVWLNGPNRASMNNLEMECNLVSGDYDDICVWTDGFTNESHMGRVRVNKGGIGLYITTAGMTFRNWYVTGANFGKVVGDPYWIDDEVFSASAVSCSIDDNDDGPADYTCGRLTTISGIGGLRDIGSTYEGNEWGDGVFFTAGSTVLDLGIHYESSGTSVQYGHDVVIGAGYCPSGNRIGKVAGTDEDCLGGVNMNCGNNGAGADANRHTVYDYRFLGGQGGTDKGGIGSYGGSPPSTYDNDPDWAGLMIGECAGGNINFASQITLDGQISQTTTQFSGVSYNVAFQWAPDILSDTGSPIQYIRAPVVDMTGARRVAGWYYPNYPKIRHAGALVIPFSVASTTWTGDGTDDFLQLWGIGTDFVGPTDNTAWVPIPNYGTSAGGTSTNAAWQMHKVEFVGSSDLTGETCDFVPTWGNADLSVRNAVSGTTVRLTGTTVNASTNMLNQAGGQGGGVTLTPNASLFQCGSTCDTIGEDSRVGIEIENTDCDELQGNGALTLLPLK